MGPQFYNSVTQCLAKILNLSLPQYICIKLYNTISFGERFGYCSTLRGTRNVRFFRTYLKLILLYTELCLSFWKIT